MAPRKNGELTVRERAFITALLGQAKGNATQAAILAGYSPKSAQQIATENLSKPVIAKALEKALQRVERASIADKVERDELATGFLRNPFLSVKERMRAMDALNKVDGRYIRKHVFEGKLTLDQALGLAADMENGKS